MRLEQLTAQHLEAVLEFERVNRAYFAATVPDRGDGLFADYPARHAALLRMQDAGTDRFHVLVDDDGAVAGRVNLVDIGDGEAELGFRVGRDFAGRGGGPPKPCARSSSWPSAPTGSSGFAPWRP